MRENYTGMDLDKIKCEDLFGTYREIASLLGVNTAVALYHTYRGQQINFPVKFFSSDYIADCIVADSKNQSVKQLATKYGYSEKWVRKIIKENKIIDL